MEFPFIVLDTETTGVDPKNDKIVELCMAKFTAPEDQPIVKTIRINPGIPIPPGATETHGITDGMVKNCPMFKQYAKGIHEFIDGVDLVGFNSNRFDIPLLYAEFTRAGIDWDHSKVNLIDASTIFIRNEERTLSAAVRFYLNQEHTDAHGAESDVMATMAVLAQQEVKYEGLPKTNAELALYCNYDKPRYDLAGCFTKDESGRWVFNFGKNKGTLATQDRRYLEWMVEKGDFAPDTTKIARSILYGMGKK